MNFGYALRSGNRPMRVSVNGNIVGGCATVDRNIAADGSDDSAKCQIGQAMGKAHLLWRLSWRRGGCGRAKVCALQNMQRSSVCLLPRSPFAPARALVPPTSPDAYPTYLQHQRTEP